MGKKVKITLNDKAYAIEKAKDNNKLCNFKMVF